MKMRHLRYFVAVAEELSFTRAAEHLNTAQPSLSQQIRQLEHEVGAQLFVRTQRSVRLTEAGTLLLTDAREILRRERLALDRIKSLGEGSPEQLRIGVIPAAELGVLPQALAELRHRRPDAQVLLVGKTPDELLMSLRLGDLDGVFCRLNISEICVLKRQGFSVSTIAIHDLVAVLPATHQLANAPAVCLGDLQGENIIGVAQDRAPELCRYLQEVYAAHGVSQKIAQVADNILATLSLVVGGEGVAILPEYIRSLNHPDIAFRDLNVPLPGLKLFFVHHRSHVPALDAFRDALPKIELP